MAEGYTSDPSIEQAQLAVFEDNIHHLEQKTTCKVVASGAVEMTSSLGNTHQMTRMERIELQAADERNSLKQFSSFNMDRRSFSMYRYVKNIVIDDKDDINELIADPTSAITRNLVYGLKRAEERFALHAAVGDAMTGRSDRQQTPVSLLKDKNGVPSINVKVSGFDYTTLIKVRTRFGNNEVEMLDGASAFMTMSEKGTLLLDDRYINSRYNSDQNAESGEIMTATGFKVIDLPGSNSTTDRHQAPYLPETTTSRKLIFLAPGALWMATKLNRLHVYRSQMHTGSMVASVDYWIGCVRKEGALVETVDVNIEVAS